MESTTLVPGVHTPGYERFGPQESASNARRLRAVAEALMRLDETPIPEFEAE
ncbi:MAG: hypothetical protein HY000_32430 [Planctomycetes bacterium]|nr:hypothetical protein [Planctomycetota bacterium]